MMHLLRLLAECRKAATAVEYGLILAVIVLTMFGALQLTAGATIDLWGNVSNKVQAAH
ncbi:MAG: Flp family type IVb pilin [Sphingomonas bacterium]|nr:Flp family type IVb pilin [Sphingomonas bacterium]MDB5679799.1 Flp family type IVb pilin [Sphingomonas bacterium]